MFKSFWLKSGGFLAGSTERQQVFTEIRGGHALKAFGLLGRHALVTFRPVLVMFWGLEASCPKGAACFSARGAA